LLGYQRTEIIHPLGAPIFTKRAKTISLPIHSGFGYQTIVNVINTYPVIVPRLGIYARLETTKETVSEVISRLYSVKNSLILAGFYNFDGVSRFVTWKNLSYYPVSEKYYTLYQDSLYLFISQKKPILLCNKTTNNGFLIKSNTFNHTVSSDVYGLKEVANVSISIVLVKFTESSISRARSFKIRRNTKEIYSIEGEILFIGKNFRLSSSKVNLAVTNEILGFLRERKQGVYSALIYSVNDWKRGDHDKRELNLILEMRELWYTPNSLISLLLEFTNINAYTYEYNVDTEFINKTMATLKEGTPYNWKTISEGNPLQILHEENGKFVFKVLKPWVIFTLLNDLINEDYRSAYAKEILSQENIVQYLDQISEIYAKRDRREGYLDPAYIYAYNTFINFPSSKEIAE